MVKKKISYNFISSGENICWLLNIRGKDLPNSPVANCKMILTKDKRIYFFTNIDRVNDIKSKLRGLDITYLEENEILRCFNNLESGNFCIDSKTCSIFEESLINYKFNIIDREDQIYSLKSIKNKTEIKNAIKAHIEDGIALTKFLYWIKNCKINNLTEIKVEKNWKILEKKIKIIYIQALKQLLDLVQMEQSFIIGQINFQIEN